jgi:hypothetical protein
MTEEKEEEKHEGRGNVGESSSVGGVNSRCIR